MSIKGLATTSAIAILAEIAVLPRDMSVRQWVAHAGLDPRLYESGTSVKANCGRRLTHSWSGVAAADWMARSARSSGGVPRE